MLVSCPNCRSIFKIGEDQNKIVPRFCVVCGSSLRHEESQIQTTHSATETPSAVTLVAGHLPKEEQIKFSIGPYQIMRPIGKGGMGEVFLAYDTSCGRRIALKRIRADLLSHQQMHNRFLKEARVTSQLTHPSIITIYEIHDDRQLAYYTMPYVEGDTLKQILKIARQKEKLGEKIDHTNASIPALIRIFLSVCQAVGYAHSKGVLHRDLKPENIIVGRYGEALILDWGLAKLTKGDSEQHLEGISNEEKHPLRSLTHLGKVVGTVSYMAPERALGNPATFQTDIYALGVILYQILTLRYPFYRKSLKEFRQTLQNEHIYEPGMIAPHRDVPDILAQISLKCLEKDPAQRYASVDELLHHLESYIEGRPDWFTGAELDVNNKKDWEFQENVLLAEYTAITRGPESSEWVSLMISKNSFDKNCKIEAEVWLGEKSHGLGFLLCIPETAERTHLNDGYTLWLSSDLLPSSKLLRSTVEVLHAPDTLLVRNRWHHVRIEKIDNHIHFYLNDILQFSYLELIPMVGTHVGLLSRDGDFTIRGFKIGVGGHNIMVNCLAVPDAFLALKDYTTALSEYRRIGSSFPGRAEGREALFRAGITLLEQAQHSASKEERNETYEQSFAEFEKLHKSAGAPLEYLGKALVYESMAEYEEEVKCFDLAMRRYPRHPLLTALKEQVIYRMHESSRSHRDAAYLFALLVVRQMQESMTMPGVKKLFSSLKKHWEQLPFIEEDPKAGEEGIFKNLYFAVLLSFWLAKPRSLEEIVDLLLAMDPLPTIAIENAIFCLIELGCYQIAAEAIDKKQAKESSSSTSYLAFLAKNDLKTAVAQIIAKTPYVLNNKEERCILYLMEKAIDHADYASLQELLKHIEKCEISPKGKLLASCHSIWATLAVKDWVTAGMLLHNYPVELLSDDGSLLHFLYGCWLYASEGNEIATLHFSSLLEQGRPRSWNLFGYYFNDKFPDETAWISKAFLWEKRQFYRQMLLFSQCNDDNEKIPHYRNLINETYKCLIL